MAIAFYGGKIQGMQLISLFSQKSGYNRDLTMDLLSSVHKKQPKATTIAAFFPLNSSPGPIFIILIS
jgi:hypothetical protein